MFRAYLGPSSGGRLRLKCDGTRAETRFRLSAKRTSPFKSARVSVQSTTGSRGVRISGSNVGYTMFRGSVKSTGYPLHSPISPSLPLPCVTVCHHISTGLCTYELHHRCIVSILKAYNTHLHCAIVQLYHTLQLRARLLVGSLVNVQRDSLSQVTSVSRSKVTTSKYLIVTGRTMLLTVSYDSLFVPPANASR